MRVLRHASKVDSLTEFRGDDTQKIILMKLFNSTNGSDWINSSKWGSDSSICEWHGVDCASNTTTNEIITSLMLKQNRLSGKLPEELGQLVSLTSLNLALNDISGSIPSNFGNFTALQSLQLWTNRLTGTLPQQFSNLLALTDLSLAENSFEGYISPYVFANMTRLENLDLSSNQFEGNIPTEFGSLTTLTNLMLSANNLRGGIPSSFGNLVNLNNFSLFGAQLDGEIPIEIGNLHKLTLLSLSENRLHGSIPATMGRLTNLEILDLFSNQLEGNIPDELGELTNLNGLTLARNRLQGSIPRGFGNLTSLLFLDLSSNLLSGAIPVEMGDLVALFRLDLSENHLSGSIPDSFGSLVDLDELFLHDNQLTGNIPSELGNLIGLETLTLSENKLEGSIPESLGNITQLQSLYLFSNYLQGDIPASVGQLPNLDFVSFASNNFTSVPGFNNSKIQHMNLSMNNIEALDYVINSQYLDVSYNPLSRLSDAFWSSPTMISLNAKNAKLTNLEEFAPPNLAYQIRELSLGGNKLGDYQDFFASFKPIFQSFNLHKLDLRNSLLSGAFEPSDSFVALQYLDLGQNPELFRACKGSTQWSSPEMQRNLQLLRIDSTKICIDDYSFHLWSPLEILDLSHSVACITDEMLELQELVSLRWYDVNIIDCHFDSSLLIDNPNRTDSFSNNNLVCPQRLSVFGAVVESDVEFLNYRNCTCQTGNYWDWQVKACVKCAEHLICDPKVNGSSHIVIGPYYPLIDGSLAERSQFPQAKLAQCETKTACNPNCLTSSCDPNSFVLCAEGRNSSSRLCSQCSPGWFVLGMNCIRCEPSYTYLVIILLPLSMIIISIYLWNAASSPSHQAVAGLSICTFGLQLLSVIDGFFPPNTEMNEQLVIPSFMIVLQQIANFRPWSLECLDSGVNFQTYFFIKMISPLFGVLLALVAELSVFARLRTRMWFVLCMLLDLAYFPLCATSLQLFQCDEDNFFMNVPYLSCTDSSEMRLLAVLAFLLYGLGIPLWFSLALWRHKADLNSMELSHLRFLIDSLRAAPNHNVILWPIWKLGRRLLLALIVTLISRHTSALPLALCLLLTVSVIVHLQVLSYRSKVDNALELFVSSACGTLYLICMLQAGFTEYNDLGSTRQVLNFGVLGVLVVGIAGHVAVPLWRWFRQRSTAELSKSLLRDSIQDRS